MPFFGLNFFRSAKSDSPKDQNEPRTPEKQIYGYDFDFDEDLALPTPPESKDRFWTHDLMKKDLEKPIKPSRFTPISSIKLFKVTKPKLSSRTERRDFGTRPEPYSLLTAPVSVKYGWRRPLRLDSNAPCNYKIYGVKTGANGILQFLVQGERKKVWKPEPAIKPECVDAYLANILRKTDLFKRSLLHKNTK